MQLFHVFISAETKDDATTILDSLLKEKLVLGGPIVEGPAKFLWKGGVSEMNYCYIFTYTRERHKAAIIETVKKMSREEIPMISFVPFEGNTELIELIEQTLS